MPSTGDTSMLNSDSSSYASNAASSVSDLFVMIAVLVGQNGQPVIATHEFTTLQNCQVAATVLAQSTKQKVDTIKCVKK